MGITASALVLFFSGLTMAAESLTSSGSDDIKFRIAECIADNKDQGQSAELVRKYCECMISKMDRNEKQSVSEWEETHPRERKKCDEVANWD